ncbi:MAG: CoA-binding protein [Bacteroidetes bacterium]|nr:CoA-binding protein [Bacteroidota bacterium]
MKTLVLGASENPERYSFRAVNSLLNHNEEVVALGIKEGEIRGVKILTGKPEIKNIDTVTIYVGPKNLPEWYDYILSLKPKRVIFNPGAENPEFEKMCRENNIEVVEACTLVMLSIGIY